MIRKYVNSFNQYIFEGGWASTKTQETIITPQTIVDCVKLIDLIFKDFKAYTSSKDFPEMKHLGTIGSGKYYLQDLKENPEKQYGDIDTAVELPLLNFDGLNARETEIKIVKIYKEMFFDFLNNKKYNFIDLKDTVSASPGDSIHLIMSPDKNKFVQVDFIVSYSGSSDWTINRFTPERGYKGFTIGGLYSALSEVLVISICQRGVVAKFQKDVLVSQKIKKDITEKIISLNFGEFLFDIAKFFTDLYDKELIIDNLLENNKGLKSSNVTIENLCIGIKGLALTLEKSGLFNSKILNFNNSKDFLDKIKEKYQNSINSQLTSTKFDKAQSELAKLAIEKVKKHAEYGLSVVNKTLK